MLAFSIIAIPSAIFSNGLDDGYFCV